MIDFGRSLFSGRNLAALSMLYSDLTRVSESYSPSSLPPKSTLTVDDFMAMVDGSDSAPGGARRAVESAPRRPKGKPITVDAFMRLVNDAKPLPPAKTPLSVADFMALVNEEA